MGANIYPPSSTLLSLKSGYHHELVSAHRYGCVLCLGRGSPWPELEGKAGDRWRPERPWRSYFSVLPGAQIRPLFGDARLSSQETLSSRGLSAQPKAHLCGVLAQGLCDLAAVFARSACA